MKSTNHPLSLFLAENQRPIIFQKELHIANGINTKINRVTWGKPYNTLFAPGNSTRNGIISVVGCELKKSLVVLNINGKRGRANAFRLS